MSESEGREAEEDGGGGVSGFAAEMQKAVEGRRGAVDVKAAMLGVELCEK